MSVRRHPAQTSRARSARRMRESRSPRDRWPQAGVGAAVATPWTRSTFDACARIDGPGARRQMRVGPPDSASAPNSNALSRWRPQQWFLAPPTSLSWSPCGDLMLTAMQSAAPVRAAGTHLIPHRRRRRLVLPVRRSRSVEATGCGRGERAPLGGRAPGGRPDLCLRVSREAPRKVGGWWAFAGVPRRRASACSKRRIRGGRSPRECWHQAGWGVGVASACLRGDGSVTFGDGQIMRPVENTHVTESP